MDLEGEVWPGQRGPGVFVEKTGAEGGGLDKREGGVCWMKL